MAMTRVLVKTLLGDMTLELDGDKAPATVANFVAYAQSGHYDRHRPEGGRITQYRPAQGLDGLWPKHAISV